MAPPTRIVMLGTGDFALPTFVHLCATGHRVERLVTQPDRPQGRKQELIPSAIKQAALERGIPVDQPEDVNAAESLERLRVLGPDLLVTAAYGQILSAGLLGIPRLGGINLHGSILLPTGARPPWPARSSAASAETGVTVIRMTPRIDAGGMIAVARTPIDPDETAGALEAPPRGARGTAHRRGDRRPRSRYRSHPAARQIPGHQGTQAPQGRRPDRLVEARRGRPQPGPRHAALASRLHLLEPRARRPFRARPPDHPRVQARRRAGTPRARSSTPRAIVSWSPPGMGPSGS